MKYNAIYIVGDIHGDFHAISYHIHNNNIINSLYIQVGDFGLGFELKKEKNELKFLNNMLKMHNCELFVIRGNHDNPSYFKNNKIESNIELLQDYTVKVINDVKFLFIGGAISIDRMNRILRRKNNGIIEYWEDENFVLDIEKLKDLKNISYVITHNAPNFVKPYNFNHLVEHYSLKDENLKLDLIKERSDLYKAYNILKVENKLEGWFYGHFHFSSTEYFDDIKFKLLSINEIVECYLI